MPNKRSKGAVPAKTEDTPLNPQAGTALNPDAERLLTVPGYANALAELLHDLEVGGTRDQVSAMTARKHVLSAFNELRQSIEEVQRHDELITELRRTQELVKANQQSASTSYGDGLSLPREGSERAN